MLPVTCRFALGISVEIPANPLFSVMIAVGQKPVFVAPVPVWDVRSVMITVENAVEDVLRTRPTLTISAVASRRVARMYVSPADENKSSPIWFGPPGFDKGIARSQLPALKL